MEKSVKTTNDITNLIIVLKSLRYGGMNKLYVTQMAKMPNILGTPSFYGYWNFINFRKVHDS